MNNLVLAGVLACLLVGDAAAQKSPGVAASTRARADSTSALAEAAWNQDTKEGSEQAIRLYLQASSQYQQARLIEQQAEMLANVAYLHNSLGRADTALVYYRRLLQLVAGTRQDVLRNETLTQIGEVYHGRGDLDSALTYYRRALPLTRKTRDRNNEGRALNDIGIAYKALGRLDSALTNLSQALTIRRELADTLGEGVTLNNMAALLQIIGKPDSALSLLRRSLVLRRATDDHPGEATTLNNIAYSYELLGQNDSALAYYREALPILQETGRRGTAGITLANMGRVYLVSREPDSALAYLNRGLATSREVGDQIGEGWALMALGRVYQAEDQPDTALAYLHRALDLLRGAGDRAFEGEALFRLGDVSFRRAAGKDLAAATAYFDSAAAVRREVGRYAGADANRLSFAEQDVRLFEEWALAWLARSEEIGPERAAQASLASAERGRAQALLDLLRSASSDTRSPAGSQLAESGAGLTRMVQRSGSAALFYLVTQDTLLIWIIPPAGELSVLREPVGRDSLAELVGALRGGLGVDDVSSSDGGFGAIATLEETRTAAPRRGLRFAEDVARTLGTILLPAEVEDRLGESTELVIVPQGPLALVPFAVLPLGRSSSALAEPFGTRHSIRYVPSLSTLMEAEGRAGIPTGPGRQTALVRALVVGNPTMPVVQSFSGQRVQLAPLPNARAEAEWLAHELGATALSGPQATETTVRSRLPRAPLVHLATHGYAFSSEAQARQSFVALAPGGGNDGELTVGELLDDSTVTLVAELVVLSACQTGLGDLKLAEGTVGLQRAFLAKGARSVLVSLWSVSDVVTDLLMKRFYTHWLKDPDAPDKAQALLRAQEDVRATPGFDHPRFWAAFQLVGAR